MVNVTIYGIHGSYGIEQALHLVGEGKKLKLTHPTYAEVG